MTKNVELLVSNTNFNQHILDKGCPLQDAYHSLDVDEIALGREKQKLETRIDRLKR